MPYTDLKVQVQRFELILLPLCAKWDICWYQNAQSPIPGNGHASTHIGISTGTGFFLDPLPELCETTGYQFVQITSSSNALERGGTILVLA